MYTVKSALGLPTFRLDAATIAADRDANRHTSRPANAVRSPAMRQHEILIAEDEPLVAFDLSECLSGLGYRPLGPVSTGVDTIRYCEQHAPDLVLMDIGLRGSIDGIVAAAYLFDRLKIPVIYVTGRTESEVLDRVKFTNPYGFILKPVKEAELKAEIEIALYKHSEFLANSSTNGNRNN
ncbi:MAG: response regulator [Bdellovibrionales bacterium]|nr:response regulator [Bdellovibrionales bacterium]